MTSEELKKLRELCEAATPGPWDTRAERMRPRAIVIAGTEQIADAAEHVHWTDLQCERNAAFIAALNPATVLSLLSHIDSLTLAIQDAANRGVAAGKAVMQAEVEKLRARLDDVCERCQEKCGHGPSADHFIDRSLDCPNIDVCNGYHGHDCRKRAGQ